MPRYALRLKVEGRKSRVCRWIEADSMVSAIRFGERNWGHVSDASDEASVPDRLKLRFQKTLYRAP